MNDTRRREIARAQKLIADAIDILQEVSDEELGISTGTSRFAGEASENVCILDDWIDELQLIVETPPLTFRSE